MTKGKVCPQCGTKYDSEHRFCQRDGATLVAENPNESLIGSVIADRYHVLEKLGEGGMGEVYLAEHVRIKRKVAVKVMRKWMSADAVALGRFHREAENASQISHSNVATIYDFGETGDGMVYFAMEYVEGEPLSEILNREGRLGVIRACHIIRQIADALAAAHALGILHRDLKPDNVMVGKTRAGTDFVKIVDFGISRVMDRGTQQFTSTGMVIGTPDYMSPEQLAGDAVDARADNYALALIAFRVLTGSPAFPGTNAQESLIARLTKPVQRLGGLLPDTAWPDAMQEVFDRALSADPDERFAESFEFASALEEAAAGFPLTADDERYLTLLRQRSLTPPRGYGTIDQQTPPYGAPTIGAGLTAPRSKLWSETPSNATLAIDPTVIDVPVTEQPTAKVPAVLTPGASETPPSIPAVPSDVPAESDAPLVSVEKPRRPMGKLALAGVAGVAVIIAVAKMTGSGASAPPPNAAIIDSAASATLPDSQVDVPVAAIIDSLPSATTTATSLLRSDAVASRFSKGVFAVSSAVGHGAGFLADSSGLIVTSANLVPDDKAITVQVDGARRFTATVLFTDKGLAVAALPPRACRACTVLPLSPDTTGVALGDSVVAIGSPESGGRIRRGVVKASSTQRLTTSFDVGGRHAGAPVASLGATVVAVASRAGSGALTLIPSAAVLQTLTRARQTRITAPSDTSTLPVWPAKRIAESERSRGLSFTDKDLDAYRVKKDGFEVLVMTPQVTAWRRTLISQPSSSPDNPFAVAPTTGKDPSSPKDPIQRWSEWEEYWRERRAVVMIDVSPEAARPPFHGSSKPVEFKKGDVESFVLFRDGTPVPTIESARFQAVPDPEAYSGKTVYRSGVATFHPFAFAFGSKFRIDVRDASRQGKVISIDIPSRAVDRIRADMAGFLER